MGAWLKSGPARALPGPTLRRSVDAVVIDRWGRLGFSRFRWGVTGFWSVDADGIEPLRNAIALARQATRPSVVHGVGAPEPQHR